VIAQGYAGMPIGMHRALHNWTFRPVSALVGAVIALGFVALYAWAYPLLMALWEPVLNAGVQWLGLAASRRTPAPAGNG